jgi:hypothetical protein
MRTLTPSFNRNKNAYGMIIHPSGQAGGTIRDESPYKCAVTPTGGGAIIADGRFGKGLKCRNATSDFHTVTYTAAAHNLGASDFGLSFWVNFYNRDFISYLYCQTININNYLYTVKNSHVSGNGLYFRVATLGVERAYYNTGALTINNGQDYFFEFSRSGANFYIFVDGISQALTTTTAIGANDIGILADPEINLCRNDVRYGDYVISEICLLKGRAGHTANYTRPTRRQ